MYGGKADSLLNLKTKGFNVPDFFIIGMDEYKEFLESNNLLEQIKGLLVSDRRDDIKGLLLKSNISSELEKRIRERFNGLDSNLVSVRSSALNEDGKSKAFAGQYDSYLNVDSNNLFEKIKLCWASFYNTSANEYYKNSEIYGMNVIVQKMIDADYAGVVFSIDPTSDTDNYSIIEIVKGLGENLVSGKVTPTKFIMRKSTNHIDLKIGDIQINYELIKELENVIIKIEKEYGCSMDVEYAIKDNKIYILQARPITTNNLCIKPYSLSITRPKSIIEMEIYYKGENDGIKSVTRNLYYFKPLFIYNPKHDNVDIYYNEVDLEEDPRLMYYYMDLDFDKLINYFNTIINDDLFYIQNVMENKEITDLNELVKKIIHIYPFISLGQLAGHFEDISERLKTFLVEFRNNYDSIIHDVSDFMIDIIKDSLSDEYKPYSYFITLDEYLNGLPDIEKLKSRKQGYIYFGDLYVTRDYEKWLKDNHISIEVDHDCSLSGDIAYSQNVTGKVCIIYSEKDFDKFEEGDILVTPMTVPKFMKVIKMSSGIITDEGGITCHASIIARELKIPCVVGCKNATKVLKDGDIVRIDGATGNIIKISS